MAAVDRLLPPPAVRPPREAAGAEDESEPAHCGAGAPAPRVAAEAPSHEQLLWHGRLASGAWPLPRLVAASDELARPGYDSVDASEYMDTPAVMRAKVKVLARLLREAEATVVYTGAGISTAAGIGDYASKAKGSVTTRPAPSLNRLRAAPTAAHRVLVALQRKGLVQEWVNQNHDGLAQKAGFPMSRLNEVHGSWFDRKNRVKQMDEEIEPHLADRLVEWSERADFCLAMGTSLCGMTSDAVALATAEKAARGEAGALGLAFVNLQRTAADPLCALRIYGKCDDVMGVLATELRLKLDMRTLEQPHWIK